MAILILLALIILAYLIYQHRKRNQSPKLEVAVIKPRNGFSQKVSDDFVRPEDYDNVGNYTREGWYRCEALARNGKFKEALKQLQVVYQAKIFNEGGVWHRAQNSICTLKRKLDIPLEGIDILDPDELTEYGQKNIERICHILTEMMQEYRKRPETSLTKDFTKEHGQWYLGVDLDNSIDYYEPDRETIEDILGQNWAQKVENSLRLEDGLPKVGEGWVNETKLKNIITDLVEPLGYRVIHRASTNWLGNQHLDIYIPDLSLAVEYMGKQHYEPVDFFGGEEAHKEIKKRDKVKKMKCTKNGVDLIRYKYDEPLEPQHVAKRICAKTSLDIEEMNLDIEVPDDESLPSYHK